VDGSAESLAALDLAADEALARVTCLALIHAFEPEVLSPAFSRELTQVRELVSAAEDRARAEHLGLAVSSVVAPETRPRCSSNRPQARAWWFSGTTGKAVATRRRPAGWRQGWRFARSSRWSSAARSTVPTPVAIHAGTRRRRRPGRLRGRGGVRVRGGRAARAPLHAVYVCGPGERTARRVLADALAVWSAKYPEVQVIRHIRRGADPVNELIDASHGAQPAIVGRHDRYGLPRRMLGAVAGQLLDRAGCSVAVVGHR
jgi:nucleotide-binding universal stress UspA family protein